MLEVVFVLAAGQNQFFFELAAGLRFELEALGVRTSLSTEGFPEVREGRAFVLLPPHEYFVLEGWARPPSAEVLRRTVMICCEQPETVHFRQNLELGRHAAAVFDINRRAVREFRARGLAVEHLRLGYSPFWDRFGAVGERPVDVAFLGAYTYRRGMVLGACADVLWRYRCELRLSDNSAPNASGAVSFVAGEDKWGLLSRSRVLLNIHQGDEPYFEWLRVIEAMHAGCVVVSETSSDYGPLVAGEHFVMGRGETLGLLLSGVLEDPGRLAAMRTAAYELLRDELPMREPVARLAEALQHASQAPVPAEAGPAQAPARAQRSPRPDVLPQPSELSLLRQAAKDARLELMELKRMVAKAVRLQENGALPRTFVAHESSAYASLSPPRVSVVVALYNQAGVVREALESVRWGGFRDVELVVIDDGSVDASREVVLGWMRENDQVETVLVCHPVNRGLPEARNTGIGFARSEFVLMLDADNVLLPQCLDRLVDALDTDPGAAFAYGILSAFDVHGPRHLLSQFPWEPQRLRRENYIDALALVRLSVLRGVGGYTTDRRLYGVEDWDLWAGLADEGHRGRFVPEILARYRVSETSMLSLTNLSHAAKYVAMRERHPELMKGVQPPSA